MEKQKNRNLDELSLWEGDVDAILKGLGHENLNRLQKTRAVNKAYENGHLNKSLFGKARDRLKEVNYDLYLITSDAIYKGLTSQQIKALEVVVQNKKKKANLKAKKPMEEEKRENGNKQLQIQISSKFVEQLQEDNTDDGQLIILTQQNKHQPTEFFKFLLESTNSSHSFLQHLSKVIDNEPLPAQKLRIFLGICGLYKGKPLDIDLNLYQPMLEHIATKAEITSKQANGFMRLSFQNCVGLSSSSLLKILLKFDNRFSGFFDQFYQYFDQFYIGHELTSLGAQIIISNLPKTSLILSIPMIKALRDPFSFNGIDSSHLETFLGIMTYQVPEDQQLFNTLLLQFKQTTKQSFERIQDTHFSQFLEELLKVMLSFNVKWFKNQVATHGLLMGVLAMIDQNKVPGSFTQELCQSLLDGNSNPNDYLERPAQLSQEGTEEEMDDLIKQLQDCNLKGTFRRIDSTLKSGLEFSITPFTAIGIDLTMIQQLFLKLCSTYQQCFLCTGAGVGKTTFLCGLAISVAINTQQPVLFLNTNKDLRYRDCMKALHWISQIKTQKITIGEYFEGERLNSVTFLSPQQFLQMQLPEQFHIVFDEVQYMVGDCSISLITLLKRATSFVGVTGSPMTTTHIQILQMLLPDSLVAQFPDPYKFNCIERPATVCRLISEWYKEIETIIQREQANAPVLFIMNTELIESCKKKFLNSKNIIFLDQCSQPELKLILEQQFARPLVNNFYRCFITTEAGGIGIDYPSSPQIEANGGVRVCICSEPKTHSDLHQFKRRTGRMSNKGIIYYVFLNKKHAGVTNYIQFIDKLLQEEEALTLIKLKNTLRMSLQIDVDSQNEGENSHNEDYIKPTIVENNKNEIYDVEM